MKTKTRSSIQLDQSTLDDLLCKACRRGRLVTIKFLLENGADIGYRNAYCISRASGHGCLHVVRYLLDVALKQGIKIPEEAIDQGIQWAEGENFWETVEYLSKWKEKHIDTGTDDKVGIF